MCCQESLCEATPEVFEKATLARIGEYAYKKQQALEHRRRQQHLFVLQAVARRDFVEEDFGVELGHDDGGLVYPFGHQHPEGEGSLRVALIQDFS